MNRWIATGVIAVLLPLSVAAQPVNLSQKTSPGDRALYRIELELKGNLLVQQEGGKQAIRVEAKARHSFAERVLAVSDSCASVSARFYSEAVVSALVAGEKSDRSLPADRRVIVARRKADGLHCFAPAGPLTRESLDLVTEHFNPHCLPGLLAGKVVTVGETWKVGDAAAQSACLLHGILKNSLSGKLTAVKDGLASFTVEGAVEGIEHGAKVAMTVDASGVFDTAAGRIRELNWKQKDEREHGAVNPQSQMEAAVSIKCETLEKLPAELAVEERKLHVDGDPPPQLVTLRQSDARDRYLLTHAREWYVTGQTDSHLILRLIEKGELVAQATIGAWTKVEPGKHSTIEEFKKAVAGVKGWSAEKVVEEGEEKLTDGGWRYRSMAEGKLDDRPVVQISYLLAGKDGDQVVVTVVATRARLRVLGTRDLELVNGIELGKK